MKMAEELEKNTKNIKVINFNTNKSLEEECEELDKILDIKEKKK